MLFERRKLGEPMMGAFALLFAGYAAYAQITGRIPYYSRFRHLPEDVFRVEDPVGFYRVVCALWFGAALCGFFVWFRVPLLEKLAARVDRFFRKSDHDLNWGLLVAVLVVFALTLFAVAVFVAS